MNNRAIISASELRRMAEDSMEKRSASSWPPPSEDSLRLIHELQIHQIELELQNQALVEAHSEISRNLEQFKDLYELAPVAYLTLDQNGRITKTNALGRKLLGNPFCQPSALRFSTFVTEDCLYLFREFLDRVFARIALESCALTLLPHIGSEPVHVILEGIAEENEQECRLVVSDITQLKNTERKLAALEKLTSELVNLPSGR